MLVIRAMFLENIKGEELQAVHKELFSLEVDVQKV